MYRTSFIRRLSTALSSGRLAIYYEAADKHPERALDMYQWNASLCASFYPPLQQFEVVLRNAMDAHFRACIDSNWILRKETFLLDGDHEGERRGLRRNVDRLKRKRQQEDFENRPELLHFVSAMSEHDNAIAESELKFWVRFLDPVYDQFWRSTADLSSVFRYADPCDRADLFAKCERIRNLRNRVAHHEPIFTRNLETEYRNIIEVIGAISPDAAQWVHSNSRVRNVLITPPEWISAGDTYVMIQRFKDLCQRHSA